MRKQQPTPVEPGTNSTEADAVVVSTSETSKPKGKRGYKRGGDKSFKINTRLSTRLIEAGHHAFVALEKPGHDVNLAELKSVWINAVRDLIEARVQSGASFPHIENVDLRKAYKAKAVKDPVQSKIDKLEARLAKLKASQKAKK